MKSGTFKPGTLVQLNHEQRNFAKQHDCKLWFITNVRDFMTYKRGHRSYKEGDEARVSVNSVGLVLSCKFYVDYYDNNFKDQNWFVTVLFGDKKVDVSVGDIEKA